MKLGKFNKGQLIVAAVAFLVTVGILFGGQALNAKLRVDNPLQNEVMKIKGVQQFKLSEDRDGLKVKLQLKKVADLQNVLESVRQLVERYHDKPVSSFEIGDSANRQLREARYQLSFYLEEATESGHYIQLKQELDSFRGLNARVYMNEDFVYIQLEQGSHYLYQAISRPVKDGGDKSLSGGGSA